MTALTDQMAADATTRLNLWISRSAGQHKRALHHKPAPFDPADWKMTLTFDDEAPAFLTNATNVSNAAIAQAENQKIFSEAGNFIEFAGDEPLSARETAGFFIGALIRLIAFCATCEWIYVTFKLEYEDEQLNHTTSR